MLASSVVMVIGTLLLGCHAHPYQAMEWRVGSKRAALVLDRLLVALRRALDHDEPLPLRRHYIAQHTPRELLLRSPTTNHLNYVLRRREKSLVDKSQDARSRAKQCFFNAVTCF